VRRAWIQDCTEPRLQSFLPDSADDDSDEILSGLKHEFSKAKTRDEKLITLSVTPKSLTPSETMTYFNAPKRLVYEARGNKDTLPKKVGRPSLSDERKRRVQDFYENSDISRPCPGAKDFVSVRNAEGKKEQKQRF